MFKKYYFEIHLINKYLKKNFYIVILLLSLSLMMSTIKVVLMNVSTPNSISLLGLGNYQFIFIGFILYPWILHSINKNIFYKNRLLAKKQFWKSNLIIFIYFFMLCLLFSFFSNSVFYITYWIRLDYFNVERNYHINISMHLVGEILFIMAILVIGRVLFLIPIKKSHIFLTVLVTLFIFVMISSFLVQTFFLIKPRSNDIQDGTKVFLNWFALFFFFSPLGSPFAFKQLSLRGVGWSMMFDTVALNENFYKADPSSLYKYKAIWLSFTIALYPILAFAIHFIDYKSFVLIKNKINDFKFKTKRNKHV